MLLMSSRLCCLGANNDDDDDDAICCARLSIIRLSYQGAERLSEILKICTLYIFAQSIWSPAVYLALLSQLFLKPGR